MLYRASNMAKTGKCLTKSPPFWDELSWDSSLVCFFGCSLYQLYTVSLFNGYSIKFDKWDAFSDLHFVLQISLLSNMRMLLRRMYQWYTIKIEKQNELFFLNGFLSKLKNIGSL